MSADEQYHDEVAERAVIAAMLADTKARQVARMATTGKEFHIPTLELLWDVMSELDAKGRPVDRMTVLSQLQAQAAKDDRIALNAITALAELDLSVVLPENVASYAEQVRGWYIRRQLRSTAIKAATEALTQGAGPIGLAASFVARFSAIRDYGLVDDPDSVSLETLLAEQDDRPEWLIPGVLERRDRLMLTGEEGMGKSHLLRQFAVFAAAGMKPWDAEQSFDPIKVTIVDCENTRSQLRARTRDLAGFATRYGADPKPNVDVYPTNRMDIVRDGDLARIHHQLDRTNPDLVVIGPLYRLVPRAIQNDDDAAPVLAALDTIRDRGCALLIEAHAGHAIGKGGMRDMRPRGSSALLGWPEFGYGMRGIGTKGYCDFVAWRGQRSERDWPVRLRMSNDGRWLPYDDARDYSHLQEGA